MSKAPIPSQKRPPMHPNKKVSWPSLKCYQIAVSKISNWIQFEINIPFTLIQEKPINV